MPSQASEFAHPDVIIGLSVLAHRYEGLRYEDFQEEVIGLLRAQFEREVGPHAERASSKLYLSWVTAAGGVLKGREPPGFNVEENDHKIVLPLWSVTRIEHGRTSVSPLLRASRD